MIMHQWCRVKASIVLLGFISFVAMASAGEVPRVEAQPAAQQAEQPNVQAAQIDMLGNAVPTSQGELSEQGLVAPPVFPLPPDVLS